MRVEGSAAEVDRPTIDVAAPVCCAPVAAGPMSDNAALEVALSGTELRGCRLITANDQELTGDAE